MNLQRGNIFIQQQMGAMLGTHCQMLFRENLNCRSLHGLSPWREGNLTEDGKKNFKHQRERRTPGEHVPTHHLNRIHRYYSSKHQVFTPLHQALLSIYVMAANLVFL